MVFERVRDSRTEVLDWSDGLGAGLGTFGGIAGALIAGEVRAHGADLRLLLLIPRP